MSRPLGISVEHDGALLHLTLARPKANIIDAEMIAALDQALARHLDHRDLKAVLLDAEGPHFSFGASVEEHLPESCAEMLRGLHALILRMIDAPVPVLVAIHGQCLGGGLEVACAGSMLFASPDANLGQPEMQLGVFAPAASCLLPERIGQPRAEEMLYSGAAIDGRWACGIGLVDHLADDPTQAALEWFDAQLAPKSASSLRMAVAAARLEFAARIRARLERVEKLYLEELMQTRDAVEGLNAFIAKRPAKWENR